MVTWTKATRSKGLNFPSFSVNVLVPFSLFEVDFVLLQAWKRVVTKPRRWIWPNRGDRSKARRSWAVPQPEDSLASQTICPPSAEPPWEVFLKPSCHHAWKCGSDLFQRPDHEERPSHIQIRLLQAEKEQRASAHSGQKACSGQMGQEPINRCWEKTLMMWLKDGNCRGKDHCVCPLRCHQWPFSFKQNGGLWRIVNTNDFFIFWEIWQ